MQIDRAGRDPRAQRGNELLECRELRGQLLAAGLNLLPGPLLTLLHHLQIRQCQLGVDHLLVAQRVDPAVDMDHVRGGEAAHDVHDGVDLADVAQELVAETLSGARPLDEAGDVEELDGGRSHPLGREHLGERVEPLVRDGDDAHVGIDRAERIVGGLGARRREGVE